MKNTHTIYLHTAILILISCSIYSGCSSDDTVTPPPNTGEVLLAEVSGDSVGNKFRQCDKITQHNGQHFKFHGQGQCQINILLFRGK
ncbi:MAG: hypothetical protein IPM38_04850 [Ignavibacteria bacterium]|nr:hypothetical protein [Ignavibacteria bacterium]